MDEIVEMIAKKKTSKEDASAKVTLSLKSLFLNIKTNDMSKKTIMLEILYNFRYEILTFIYIFAIFVRISVLNRLCREMLCYVNCQFSETVCENLLIGNIEKYEEELTQIQKAFVQEHIWAGIVCNLYTGMLTLIFGSFSDHFMWRKPFLLVPIAGDMLGTAGAIACSFYPRQLKGYSITICQMAIPSLFGGWPVFAMALFSSIADNCPMAMRTFRISFLFVLVMVTVMIGKPLGVLLQKKVGSLFTLIISFNFMIVSWLYCLIFIKENNAKPHKLKDVAKEILNCGHIFDTLRLLKIQEEGNYIVLWSCLLFVSVLVNDENSMLREAEEFDFLLTQKYGWTEVEFHNFISIQEPLLVVCSFVALIVLIHFYSCSEYLILFIAFISTTLGGFFRAFAVNVTVYYIATAAGCLTNMTMILRAMLANVVAHGNIGKSQSLFALFRSIGSAIVTTLFMVIFNFCSRILPGAPYLIRCLLYSISTALALFLYHLEVIAKTQEIDVEIDAVRIKSLDGSLMAISRSRDSFRKPVTPRNSVQQISL